MAPGTTTITISLRTLNRIRNIGIITALAAFAVIAILVSWGQYPGWAGAALNLALFFSGMGAASAAVAHFLVPIQHRN